MLEFNITLNKYFIHCTPRIHAMWYGLHFSFIWNQIQKVLLWQSNHHRKSHNIKIHTTLTTQLDKVSRLFSGKVDYLCVLKMLVSFFSNNLFIWTTHQMILIRFAKTQPTFAMYATHYTCFLWCENKSIQSWNRIVVNGSIILSSRKRIWYITNMPIRNFRQLDRPKLLITTKQLHINKIQTKINWTFQKRINSYERRCSLHILMFQMFQ